MLVLLGVQTWHQGYVYGDMETLWTDTFEKNPLSWMAHNNLGIRLKKQGKLEEAVERYSEVLRIKPDYVQARDNLHLALQKTGKTNKPATTGARP